MTKLSHHLTPLPYRSQITDDPETILRFAADNAVGSALVSLVEIRGGAARALGAQMAVREDGSFIGYISGGCVEAAVAAEALIAIKHKSDRYLLLGDGSPFIDIVLPCGGGIKLAIHVVKDAAPLLTAAEALAQRRRVSLRYDPSQQSISCNEPSSTGWSAGMFTVEYRPVPQLVIAGSGIESEALAKLGRAMGYALCENIVSADADTAVVLLLHDIEKELPLLEAAFRSAAFYIGALGSKRTHERRCERLVQQGYTTDQIAKIKGPVGLFGPARTSTSVALSVLAEIASIRGD